MCLCHVDAGIPFLFFDTLTSVTVTVVDSDVLLHDVLSSQPLNMQVIEFSALLFRLRCEFILIHQANIG